MSLVRLGRSERRSALKLVCPEPSEGSEHRAAPEGLSWDLPKLPLSAAEGRWLSLSPAVEGCTPLPTSAWTSAQACGELGPILVVGAGAQTMECCPHWDLFLLLLPPSAPPPASDGLWVTPWSPHPSPQLLLSWLSSCRHFLLSSGDYFLQARPGVCRGWRGTRTSWGEERAGGGW